SLTCLLAVACLVTVPAERACALATENVGNEPIANGFGFSTELLAAVNVSCRVYWFEVNSNPYFYFRGNGRELNDALRRFAAIPAEKREIILLPGPAETSTLTGAKRIAYDWSLHVPMGLRFDADSEISDNRATLTIHIPAPRVAPVTDVKQVER